MMVSSMLLLACCGAKLHLDLHMNLLNLQAAQQWAKLLLTLIYRLTAA